MQGEYDDAIAATDRALASSSGPPDGFIAVNLFLFVLLCTLCVFSKKKQLFLKIEKGAI